MTCGELAGFLMTYLDGELPSAQREVFEEHVETCPPCRVYLDTYRQTVALERSVCEHPGDPVPENVPEALVRAVLAARRRG